MTKHIVDKGHSASRTGRAHRFTEIEARKKPSEQAKSLQRRPKDLDGSTRAKRFLDIERHGGETV